MEEAILELESHPEDGELIQTIFRVVHTIKGNAGILELPKLQTFAHSCENLLDELRSQTLAVTPQIVICFFPCWMRCAKWLQAPAMVRTKISSRGQSVLGKIAKCLEGVAKSGKGFINEQHPLAANESITGTALAKGIDSLRTVRLKSPSWIVLLDLTGEIAIARGRVAKLLENPQDTNFDELKETSQLADSLYSELQETVLKARMVPMGRCPAIRPHRSRRRKISRQAGTSGDRRRRRRSRHFGHRAS